MRHPPAAFYAKAGEKVPHSLQQEPPVKRRLLILRPTNKKPPRQVGPRGARGQFGCWEGEKISRSKSFMVRWDRWERQSSLSSP